MPLSADQRRTLTALVDCIIPADDFPSASANGVLDYIDRILNSDLQHRTEEVHRGLKSLDDQAQSQHGRPFADLDDPSTVALLKAIEGSSFIEFMVTLTNEGYYTDPTNGSNVGGASWKMIGYDPRVPPTRAREKWLEGLA